MATKSYATVYEDSILVRTRFDGSLTGVKVGKSSYVSGVEKYYYVVQYGKVVNNEFVLNYNGSDVSILTVEDIKSSYSLSWIKDVSALKSGDILKDSKGRVYLVEGPNQIWDVLNGTWATLDYWENRSDDNVGRGKLTEVLTSARQKYSKVLSEKFGI